MSEPTRNVNKAVSYSELISFFLPLAVMPMMISMTHNIINASLARLPLPGVSLAIFTVVKSITNIANAPTIMSRQMILSLVDDRQSYNLTKKFLWTMAVLLFLLVLLLGVTPLGDFLLKDLIGIKDSQKVSLAKLALCITSFLPITVLFRNVYQGLATGLKRTKIIVPGVALRLTIISAFLWWVVSNDALTGVIAGSIAWIVGIAIEGTLILGFIIYLYQSPAQAAEKMPDHGEGKLSLSKLVKFFTPLAAMMILTKFLQPIIQSGIARGYSPTQSLAAYGVAWSLVFLFSSSIRMLHQLSLVYTDKIGDSNWKKIKRFSLITGLIVSAMVLVVALTPVGYFILHRIIAVSPQVTELAQQTILAFSLYPLIRAFREAYWGVLMRQRTTSLIAGAKTANLIIVSLTIIISLAVFSLSAKIPAAVIGAIAFTLGELVETIYIQRKVVNDSRYIKQSQSDYGKTDNFS